MQTPPDEDKDEISRSHKAASSPSASMSSNYNASPTSNDNDDIDADNKSSSAPSAFISAPSIASHDSSSDLNSSVDDANKKRLYRRQLLLANGQQQQQQRGGGGDDDTSLSSSNLSPMPQGRVVQLTSSISDLKFTERREQIKAAARGPLLNRLQSETTTTTASSGNNNEALLEAALLPPSVPDESAASITGDQQQQEPRTTTFPTLPKLGSADSLRGMDITSSGGEESSISNHNIKNTTQPPETEIISKQQPRTRRKLSHKRQRSGDLVAATFMNPGKKDWIGMNRDNLPLPATPNYEDDGSSSLLLVPTPEDGEESSGGGGGPMMRMSNNMMYNHHHPLYPSPMSSSHADNTSNSGERIFSPDSSEMYEFSDSTTVSNTQQLQFQQQHEQYLHPQQQSGYMVDPRQQQMQQQQMQQQQYYPNGQYNPMPMYDAYGYNPNNMQWYQPNYQHNNNSHVPEIYRRRNGSEEGSESFYTGSGGGEGGGSTTTTSSSYVSEEEEEDASKSSQSSSSSASSSSRRHNGEIPHSFSISGHNTTTTNVKVPSLDMESPELHTHFNRERADSRIDQIIQKVTSVLDVPLYRTKEQAEIPTDMKYPTFFCPNCKTKQRAFLSVATASEQQSSPLGYLALYFAVYMIASLFIFGLEEGWQPLDCVYFSVITLTTAGLGDFVPTTDGAKIVCACFIYVGVATIGLLLGSLLAGTLDDATKKDAYNAQVKDCPNCQRLERLKGRPTMSSGTSPMGGFPNTTYYNDDANGGGGYEEVGEVAAAAAEDQSSSAVSDFGSFNDATETPARRIKASHTRHMSLLVSSSPRSQQKKILSTALPQNSALKKTHTRHMSLGGSLTTPNTSSAPDGLDKIDESTPLIDLKKSEHSNNDKTARSNNEVKFCEESSYSTSSTDDTSILHPTPSKPLTRLKAAKYIFLTLNQALANSVFVIAVGSIGFYYIEDMSVVDSFYFTTVLLTSVGYGDIVPVTAAGKMFTTVFIIVAGTILLHNMTLISMIPLELRKRRIEHAVLGQFGDQLTDDELRELSTGTLVNRLKLATNRPDGLDECTREMFSLAMLVRLGRVTEEDVKATFAAFRRLDVGNYGRLNSRTIIEGELMRRRALSSKNLAAMSKEGDWEDDESPTNYSHASFAQGGGAYAPQIPVPHFQFFDYPQQGQMPMYSPNYGPGMYGGTPRSQFSSQFSPGSPHTQYSGASRFNLDEYERWASNWGHYDTLHQAQSH